LGNHHHSMAIEYFPSLVVLFLAARRKGAPTAMAIIMSVLGPITERDLGITLTHEHLFFDLSTWLQKPKLSSRLELEVTLSTFDAVHRAPFSSRDNLIFSNVRISITEVLRFKDAGGG